MAVLDANNRSRIWAHLMRQSEMDGIAGITKQDLKAAVDATDDWIDSNAASFNTALPLAFRTNATLVQKTFLFCYVAMRRAGILRTQEDA